MPGNSPGISCPIFFPLLQWSHMPQRMVHWLFGELLIDERIENPDRFRIGNLLPDAYSDPSFRRTTHFVKQRETEDGTTLRYCDFSAFMKRFEDLVRTDDLYLGYGMHLLEDAVTRSFWKRENIRVPRTPKGIETLHLDYHILNKYLTSRYDLTFHAHMPEGFAEEAILEVYPFDLPAFLKEFQQDFHDSSEGSLQILTIPLTERMIEEAIPILRKAKDLLLKNEMPDYAEYTW